MRLRRLGLLLALVLVAVGCATTTKYDPLPVPEGLEDVPTTSSTVPTDIDEVVLPGVPGTTSTTGPAIGPGPVTIVGRVDGPDGPVAGARIRLERLGEGGVASVEVPAAADGSWNAANVLGGRYRIRAWLAPSFGMARAQVVFVESPKAKPVVLRVDRFEGFRIDAAIAPNPPVVGSPANLKVRVTDRQVDAQGIVRAVPRVGVTVTLSGAGSWSATPNPSLTDGEGNAAFEVTCGAPGAQPLTAVLATGESQPLELPACV